MVNQPNWIVLGVSVLAVVLGIFVLVLGWGTVRMQQPDTNAGGFTFEGGTFEWTLNLFDVKFAGESQSWYHDDFDDSDGAGLMRVAIPVVTVGLVGLLAATVFSAIPPSLFKPQRIVSGAGLLGAGLILLIGTILALSGQIEHSKEFGPEAVYAIGMGVIFAFVVSAVTIAAGVLALVMKSGPQIGLANETTQKA